MGHTGVVSKTNGPFKGCGSNPPPSASHVRITKMNRGERRRRSAVIYKKRLDEHKQTEVPWGFIKPQEPHKTYYLKDTPRICSCNCCRSGRKNEWSKKKDRITKQEKFNNMKFNEELKDAG